MRDTSPGVVLPLARSPIRTDAPRTGAPPTPRYLGIGRLLRIASARGASSLFLTANARPSIRIDDEPARLDRLLLRHVCAGHRILPDKPGRTIGAPPG